MPIFMGIIATLLIVTAMKGNQAAVMMQVKKDFTGSGNFLYWILAILVLGAIGYVPMLQKGSKLLVALIVIVFIVANKGIFAKIQQALSGYQWPTSSSLEGQANVVNQAPSSGATPSSGGGGSTPTSGSGGNTPSTSPGGSTPSLQQWESSLTSSLGA